MLNVKSAFSPRFSGESNANFQLVFGKKINHISKFHPNEIQTIQSESNASVQIMPCAHFQRSFSHNIPQILRREHIHSGV